MKILHLDQNHPLLIDKLNALGHENHEAYELSKAAVEEIIAAYDGIVIRSRFVIDSSFLEKAKNLRFIARVGAGLESIDVEAAESRNIVLITAPEGNRNAVAEHALGMLLSLFNKLHIADSEVRKGLWNREANRGVELDGKTVGIIGYGNMGKAFAKKLSGFNTEVLCYDLLKNVGDTYAQQVPLTELQKKADVLSLHTPWTPQTHNMINTAFIASFKKPFWLINTARGKSVVTADLVKALQSKKILGAALDVLEFENLSFESLFSTATTPESLNELLKLQNVIISPHIAGWTVESKINLAEVIVNKIANSFPNQ
ncbi:MAG TPA: 2-hydroxyacid dehydrogenase [Flavobacteriaceae bacterium]|nr:2-hydroxyacid dehydrogenase [Flavobacteriaceae bacterium]